jgi:polyphosphate kinase
MGNLYQIREISTLSFNERVLQEAEDQRNPLLERLKFLGIFSSNMDEFFKVRVASIRRRIELGQRSMWSVLEVLTHKARELDERFLEAYGDITTELAREGVRILTERCLDAQSLENREWLSDYFHENVLPTLVPIIVHKPKLFPQLTDGALYFAINMIGAKTRYAILEIPSELPRFVQLPSGDIMYLDDVIRFFLNEIFYIFEYEIIDAFELKISRDAELDIDNDFSEGYVRKMERGLQRRKGGRPVRLVYDATMPSALLELLLRALKISPDDPLIPGGRYHNMKDLMQFPSKRPDLSFEEFEIAPHPILDAGRGPGKGSPPMLDVIAERDIMITCPFQSFDHIVRLIREAAIDPGVEEIRMTLYRAAHQSRIVNALVNAARNGKHIFASVELQARFDETNNLKISERLKESNATVVFGVPPMKVHGKLLLIKREGRSYAGLSTGNFNETTGKRYIDSTLLTSDPRLTREVEMVFNFLEDAARIRVLPAPKFKHLLVSPFNTRKVILRLLTREMKKGSDGYVFLKVNHLTDESIIAKIQKAADAGVKMDLIVRTTYAMLPHPNIRAISILDRYLEHQRVYIFGKGEDRIVYMSSADMMVRNIDSRIEVAFPIYDKALQEQVDAMMRLQIEDNVKARVFDETQSNQYVDGQGEPCRAQYETHSYFMKMVEDMQ